MTLDKLTREYLKAREELILSHARAGHSLTETADRLDVSRQALWNLIWRNGIPWHEAANRERVDP